LDVRQKFINQRALAQNAQKICGCSTSMVVFKARLDGALGTCLADGYLLKALGSLRSLPTQAILWLNRIIKCMSKFLMDDRIMFT